MRKITNYNLDDLYEYLLEVFEYIDIVRDQPCIIAFGNTGCGKSTMFNALVHGSSVLKERMDKVEIEIPI